MSESTELLQSSFEYENDSFSDSFIPKVNIISTKGIYRALLSGIYLRDAYFVSKVDNNIGLTESMANASSVIASLSAAADIDDIKVDLMLAAKVLVSSCENECKASLMVPKFNAEFWISDTYTGRWADIAKTVDKKFSVKEKVDNKAGGEGKVKGKASGGKRGQGSQRRRSGMHTNRPVTQRKRLYKKRLLRYFPH